MPRSRRRSITVSCHTDGCGESTFFEYSNSTEYVSSARAADAWKCLRHKDTTAVLRPNNPRVAYEATVAAETYGLFWSQNGKPVNGLLHGPGFYAFAADFPEGTRLRVTAEIVPATKDDCICPFGSVDGAAPCPVHPHPYGIGRGR